MVKKMINIPLGTKILILSILLVIASVALISFFAVVKFEKEIVPEMDKKSMTVGASINTLIIKALGYGIPFTSLNGMKELFDSTLKDNSEIKYIVVTDPKGNILYKNSSYTSGLNDFFKSQNNNFQRMFPISNYYDSTIPIKKDTDTLGLLHIGVDRMFVQNKIKDIIYDIIAVLVVSFLITFEIVLFIVAFAITGPIESIRSILPKAKNGDFTQCVAGNSKDEIGRFIDSFNKIIFKVNEAYNELKERYNKNFEQLNKIDAKSISAKIDEIDKKYVFTPVDKLQKFSQRLLIYIRPALFLVIFSESFSVSFFPMYVDQLYKPLPWVSKDLVIGLPISIFMFFWAMSLPFGGAWSERIGRRKPFFIGAITTGIGLVLTGLAGNIYELLVWRSITAVGYGIVYITCQGYVTDNTTPQNRTRGMAMFLSSFFSGSLCGAAIGGILADRIGFRATFFVSSSLSIISAIFAYYFLRDYKIADANAKNKIRFSHFKLLLSNGRFLTLTLFSAIPAKICLTGFLYYIVPLYLKSLGNSQSAIGRVLMCYGISMVLISPAIAKLADILGNRKRFVIVGGIVSGIALFMVHYTQNTLGVLFSVALLGSAHAVGVSSQLTMITEVCKDIGDKIGLGTVIGIFRLMERIGNITGPLISGFLIAIYGFPVAIAIIGVTTFIGSILLPLSYLLFDVLDKQRVYNPETQ